MFHPRCQRCITVALIVCGLAAAASAQFWVKEPFENWSREDCARMLSDSPWGKSHVVGRVFIQRAEEQAAVPGRDQTPQITYVVRLLSALPIRQAMVRLAQLDPNYAKLAPEQKQELDARRKSLLDKTYPDRIVIQIAYSTNALAYRSELTTLWQSQAEEVLKQEIRLITRRGRIPPARVFVAPGAGGDIQIIFPRQLDGRPLVAPDDKNLGLEFQHPTIGVLSSERVFVEFKVKNLLVNNELVF